MEMKRNGSQINGTIVLQSHATLASALWVQKARQHVQEDVAV